MSLSFILSLLVVAVQFVRSDQDLRRGNIDSTCGNGIIDDGELCDGGSHCDSNCQCFSDYQPTTPISSACVANPCATFACGFTALNIGCSYDVTKLEYTCTCPDGWITKDGLQSETMKAHQVTFSSDEFYGCVSYRSPPSLRAIMTELQKNPAAVENGIMSVNSHYIVSVASIDPATSTMQFLLTLPHESAKPSRGWLIWLRSYLSHLVNVHSSQVFIDVDMHEQKDKKVVISVGIIEEQHFAAETSSGSRLELGFVVAVLLSALSVLL